MVKKLLKTIQNNLEKINLLEAVKENPIVLVEKDHQWTAQEMKDLFPGKNIVACDVYLKDIESKTRIGNIFRDENVLNMDHHSNILEMEREVSATNLAIDYVKENGPLPRGENCVVVISHTDCDSILSSLIMRGIIAPEDRFGEAAIAADHTGFENEIADLLQAIDEENVKGDFEFSLRNLQRYLNGETIEDKAVACLKNRQEKREKASVLVEKGEFKNKSGVYYALLKNKIDSELIPSLIPGAKIILLYSPYKYNKDPENIGWWEAKTRLGKSAEGINLQKIMKKDERNSDGVDEKWGGRWNAGSNGRSGGTKLDIEEYAKLVAEGLSRVEREIELKFMGFER